MGIRKLVKINHEALKEKAFPVKKITAPIGNLIRDMVETMYHHKGVGLAAPQIGISKQIIVVDAGDGELYKLINPVIVDAEGEEVGIEGCLSVPGVCGEVKRAERVVVEALDEKDVPVRLIASGFLARILQHEIDHLHGILFVEKAQRIVDPDELGEKGENL
ncbi:MAG: peptide deformylase [Firmicutes bacterium]|nr:peptide deformylase [Bacillota bacterium]